MLRQEDLKKSIGSQVRTRRESKGISQTELAQRVGLHDTALSHIEAGRRFPNLTVLMNLCAALGITPNTLLKGGY